MPARSGEAGGCRALINFQIFYQSAWSVTEIVAIKTLLFLLESAQIVFLTIRGLAAEATVTLQWCPGEREARVLDIHTPPGSTAVPAGIATRVDLSLARSGATFPISDIVEIARWGHFERGDVPWEAGQRI